MTFDTQFFFLLNGLAGQSPFFDRVIVFCASYLPYIAIAALLGALLFSRYPKREKLEIVLVTAISGIVARFGVAELIRFFYHRPRPFSVLSVHQLLADTAWSFPSGHAIFFFAVATAAYLYNKTWGIALFVAAVLISVSRVIAGIHYPSDIVAGALLGTAIAYVLHALLRGTYAGNVPH